MIVQGLLDEYGYRGTLLIWGALLTHICAASALFQPPIWHKIHIPGPMCSDHFLPNPTDANKNAVEDNNSKDTVKIADVLSNERLCADEPSYKIDEMKLIQVLDGIKTTNTTSEATSNKCKQFNVPMNSKDSEHLMADTDKVYNDCGPLSSSTIARIESSLNIDYVIDDSECEKSEDDERRKKTKMHRRKCKTCFGGHCGRGMIKQLDYSLFKDFRFYIVASSGICTSFAITNSFVFLPPLGQDKGFSPSQTAWLLSSVGIGEIFGRLITPWLRDLGIIRAKHAYMLGAIMSSIIAFGKCHILVLNCYLLYANRCLSLAAILGQ